MAKRKQLKIEDTDYLNDMLEAVENLRAYRSLLYVMQSDLTESGYHTMSDRARDAFGVVHEYLWKRECHYLGIIMGFLLDPEVMEDTRKRAYRIFVDKYCAPNMALDYLFGKDRDVVDDVKKRMAKLAGAHFNVHDEEE